MTTVMTDERIDPDRLIFEGVDTYRERTDKKGNLKVDGPIFTVSECAKFFFARTNHWIRWLESNGKMAKVRNPRVHDPDEDPDKERPPDCKVCKDTRIMIGKDSNDKPKVVACGACTVPVGARRDQRMGNRIYTLGDVEEMAHALAANGSISGAHLRHTLRILRSQGEMYEIL